MKVNPSFYEINRTHKIDGLNPIEREEDIRQFEQQKVAGLYVVKFIRTSVKQN